MELGSDNVQARMQPLNFASLCDSIVNVCTVDKCEIVVRIVHNANGVMVIVRWEETSSARGHSKLYSTATRHASGISGARPCLRRLEREGKRVSQAGQGCPVSLDMLWPSRERERFDVCETWRRDKRPKRHAIEKTHSVVVCMMWIRLSFERGRPCV